MYWSGTKETAGIGGMGFLCCHVQSPQLGVSEARLDRHVLGLVDLPPAGSLSPEHLHPLRRRVAHPCQI